MSKFKVGDVIVRKEFYNKSSYYKLITKVNNNSYIYKWLDGTVMKTHPIPINGEDHIIVKEYLWKREMEEIIND